MFQWLITHSPILYFTQSLWRDEVFSIFVAQKPLSFIATSVGFEPPVYYALLHFWIQIFGTSEIAARSLSLVGFALATIVVIVWSEKLFKTRFLHWFVPLFFFLNPMLLYYAFEVRTYGWYTLFAVLSMYGYVNKKWPLWVAASVLGFYTHAYMAVFLFAQGVHWIATNRSHLKLTVAFLKKDPYVRSFTAIGLLILPWIVKILRESARLKDSWYFPVDLQLIWSVLGNMFLGYEGTPWHLWDDTALLSLAIVILGAIALAAHETRKKAQFFAIFAILPLALMVGISFVKPLFVNRYLLPSTIGLVFLVGLALEALQNNKTMQRLFAAAAIVGVVAFNLWYPNKHAKLPIRDTLNQINLLKEQQDIVLAASPLIFFESIYYSSDPSRVFLYNPQGVAFPWYVGDAIVSPQQMVRDFPPHPVRAFLVKEDGSFELVFQVNGSVPKNTQTPTGKRL
jgi:uncharacterized membrane protein